MGFRNGAWATVWEVKPNESGKSTRVRISIQKKDGDSYKQTFGKTCLFVGKANEEATKLKVRDRIKLGECDCENWYSKEEEKEYETFLVYTFSTSEGESLREELKSTEIEGDSDDESFPY